MQLINVATWQFQEFDHEDAPRYAILSHTWGKDNEELTFQEIQTGTFRIGTIRQFSIGYLKLEGLCERAKADNIDWVWIDTCCIDKSSNRILEGAINNMYKWYETAHVCYAYLSDVPHGDNIRAKESKFSKSRWFERGWTLQELLAPANLQFYDHEWAFLGDKRELKHIVSQITNIPVPYLIGAVPLYNASVAQRMSWAAKRTTTKREDRAYCLVGIFQLGHLKFFDGEGDSAFHRLQMEIIKVTNDDSILAWDYEPHGWPSRAPRQSALVLSAGVLATSPANFVNCGFIVSRGTDNKPNPILDPECRFLPVRVSRFTTPSGQIYGLLNCGPEDNSNESVAIPLVSVESSANSSRFKRPQKCSTIPLGNNVSLITPEEISVQIERGDTVKDRRYWFMIDDSNVDSETKNLKLVDVCPGSSWNKLNDTIETPNDSIDVVFRRYLTRFRYEDEESKDFLVVLDYKAQGTRPSAQCHVMLCDRELESQTLYEKLDTIGVGSFGKQEASYGGKTVLVTVTEESVGREPWLVVRLVNVSRLKGTTVDACRERPIVDLRSKLTKNLQERASLAFIIEREDQRLKETTLKLTSKRTRQATIKGELEKLLRESEDLTRDIEQGAQKEEQLGNNMRKSKQQQDALAKEETVIRHRLESAPHQESNSGTESVHESTPEAGRPHHVGWLSRGWSSGSKLAQEMLLFYTLTQGPAHLSPRAKGSYWRYLTLEAHTIYERIYERCRDCGGPGDVSYAAFRAQFQADDKPSAGTVARTWSRLLDEGSALAGSRQPKGLAMATLYMLHVERFLPSRRPTEDDPDGKVPVPRKELLRSFGHWVECFCSAKCEISWNFANDIGLYRGNGWLDCSLVRHVDNPSRLNFFGLHVRSEALLQTTKERWRGGE